MTGVVRTVQRRKTSAHSSVTIIDIDGAKSLSRGMLSRHAISSAFAAARKTKEAFAEAFETDGFGSWPENRPRTIKWKGHDRILEGRTDTLHNSVKIKQEKSETVTMGSRLVRTEFARIGIGWLDEDHPDSDLTMAELAALHEEGFTIEHRGESIQVPPRPTISLVYAKRLDAIEKTFIHHFLTRMKAHTIPFAG